MLLLLPLLLFVIFEGDENNFFFSLMLSLLGSKFEGVRFSNESGFIELMFDRLLKLSLYEEEEELDDKASASS